MNSTLPATLEAIVLKCLEKQPQKRYPSALALADDLKNFRDHKPTIAKPIAGLHLVAYQLQKHFMLATVSGSAVTLLVLMTAMIVFAHVRLLDKNMQVQSEMEELASILSAERNLFRIRISSLRNEDVSEAELAADRLAFYASKVQDDDLEFAARLALESIKQAHEASLPESPATIDILRRYLENYQAGSDNETKRDSTKLVSNSEIVSLAERTLISSLSDDQKSLFGIGSPLADANSAENIKD